MPHAKGYVRETAESAFFAWRDWNGTSPEPTVAYGVLELGATNNQPSP